MGYAARKGDFTFNYPARTLTKEYFMLGLISDFGIVNLIGLELKI